jgi:uncharacterized membrane protein YphA (DoxX/SURF4 family)
MKKLNIIYWTTTVLFAGFMLMSGIQNAMATPESVKLIVTDLGYPHYFVSYIGVVKILGAIALLIPGFPRVSEWAYAGLLFDLTSATFSMLAIGTPILYASAMLPFFIVGIASYIYFHKRLKALAAQNN